MFIDNGTDKSVVELLNKSQKFESNSFEKRKITFAGDSKTLDKIEKMLAYMERLGDIGHSTDFTVGVDGDGGFSVRITDNTGDKLSKKWLDEITSPHNDKDIESFVFD